MVVALVLVCVAVVVGVVGSVGVVVAVAPRIDVGDYSRRGALSHYAIFVVRVFAVHIASISRSKNYVCALFSFMHFC